MEQLKTNESVLKAIVEFLFTFDELDDKYGGVDSNTGNIYCPFHPHNENLGVNTRSPSAKVYHDEEKDIQVIHCFTSKKTYTVFHYIKFVLQKDPHEYLLSNKNKSEIKVLYDNILKGYIDISNTIMEQKIQYVDNTYQETFNTVDYIEKLYTKD